MDPSSTCGPGPPFHRRSHMSHPSILAVSSGLILALALTACGQSAPTFPQAPTSAAQLALAKKAAKDRDLVVYSQNVYVGTDVDAVLAAPADEVQTRLFTALQTFVATNWPERADA